MPAWIAFIPPLTAIVCGRHPYSRKGFMASPSTTSLPAPRRLIEEPCPAQSSAVWKTRRVLTGSSTVAAPAPGPTITSGTCIVD